MRFYEIAAQEVCALAHRIFRIVRTEHKIVKKAFHQVFLCQQIYQVAILDRYCRLVSDGAQQGVIFSSIAPRFVCVTAYQTKMFGSGDERSREQRIMLRILERVQSFERSET